MAGYVCSIAGAKGGVGKTTTAVNIAATLAADGYDVVVVDADLKMANLGDMLGIETDQGIHTVLAGDGPMEDSITEAQSEMAVVPGELELEAYANADPSKLRGVIDHLKAEFNIVLVDTGAGMSHEMTVPLGLSDGVLLLTSPSSYAVNDARKTIELIDRVDGNIIGGLVNCVTTTDEVNELYDELDIPLLGAIPVDHDATKDEPLVLNHPTSNVAEAYHTLATALEGVFFEGKAVPDIEMVFEEAWFEEVGDADIEGDSDQGGSFELFE